MRWRRSKSTRLQPSEDAASLGCARTPRLQHRDLSCSLRRARLGLSLGVLEQARRELAQHFHPAADPPNHVPRGVERRVLRGEG
eukprot:3342192-Rhodomonas_salina.2